MVVAQEKLAAEFPGTPKYAERLAGICAKLAECARARKAWPRAKNLYESALAAHAADEYCLAVCEAALEEGDHACAFQHAPDMAQRSPDEWGPRVFAAERIVRALSLVRKDPGLDETKRAEIEETYSHQAVDLLSQAVKQGYLELANFSTPDLTAGLRRRADFQELVNAPAAPPPPALHKFRIDYDGAGDPGPRRWVRDGVTWIETQPSGQKSVFLISRRTTVDGIPGNEIRRISSGGGRFFIPDPGTQGPMKLRINVSKGAWPAFAKMLEAE